MYKELVISILIVIIIFSLDFVTQTYTSNSINKISDDLSNLKNGIQQTTLTADEAIDNINSIYDDWQDSQKKLVLYIEHNELEKVETNFVATKALIETQQYDVALADLEQTVFVLEHINKKYKISLENIF